MLFLQAPGQQFGQPDFQDELIGLGAVSTAGQALFKVLADLVSLKLLDCVFSFITFLNAMEKVFRVQ